MQGQKQLGGTRNGLEQPDWLPVTKMFVVFYIPPPPPARPAATAIPNSALDVISTFPLGAGGGS